MEYYAIRQRLGLSTQKMGERLGLPPKNAGRQVRRWEAGDRRPSAAVVRMYEILGNASLLLAEKKD